MDGAMEIFAVNNIYDLGGEENIPRVYKFEWNSATETWDSVWSATTDRDGQNTWPALTWGDWDNDGKYEVYEHRVEYDIERNIKIIKNSELYKQAEVWSDILIMELITGKEYIYFFLNFIEKYANDINDDVRPYMKDTWENGYFEWIRQLKG